MGLLGPWFYSGFFFFKPSEHNLHIKATADYLISASKRVEEQKKQTAAQGKTRRTWVQGRGRAAALPGVSNPNPSGSFGVHNTSPSGCSSPHAPHALHSLKG